MDMMKNMMTAMGVDPEAILMRMTGGLTIDQLKHQCQDFVNRLNATIQQFAQSHRQLHQRLEMIEAQQREILEHVRANAARQGDPGRGCADVTRFANGIGTASKWEHSGGDLPNDITHP